MMSKGSMRRARRLMDFWQYLPAFRIAAETMDLMRSMVSSGEVSALVPDLRIVPSGFQTRADLNAIKTIIHVILIYLRLRSNQMGQEQFKVYGYRWVVLAAFMLVGVPVVLQEQNSIPGMTNTFLAPFSDLICCGFADAVRCFPSLPAEWTGNPVRDDFFGVHAVEPSEPRRRWRGPAE